MSHVILVTDPDGSLWVLARRRDLDHDEEPGAVLVERINDQADTLGVDHAQLVEWFTTDGPDDAPPWRKFWAEQEQDADYPSQAEIDDYCRCHGMEEDK